MSLFNLSEHYSAMRFRVQLAEDQLNELQELLCGWFLQSDCGAREFLVEVARLYREGQSAAKAVETVFTHTYNIDAKAELRFAFCDPAGLTVLTLGDKYPDFQISEGCSLTLMNLQSALKLTVST